MACGMNNPRLMMMVGTDSSTMRFVSSHHAGDGGGVDGDETDEDDGVTDIRVGYSSWI